MNDVSPGKLTLLIGAAVTFVFSWFPWYSISGFGSSFSRNAWQSGTFPMATWAPLLALVVGFVVAAQAFKFLELPEKLWEFTLDQVVLILSIFALLVTLSYLIVDKGGASIGFGLIVCFLGTVAMVAGFFMDRAGVGVNPNAVDANASFQQPGFPPPGQQPGAPQSGQHPPTQAPPAQAPPAQQPPTQQPPQADPGSF
ncbi:MAG TPA: hypothetical protein VFN21_01765 [Acidimicrobiales bacterium]|nr:hypothetical protein [Acidimicrobiales bacterium]